MSALLAHTRTPASAASSTASGTPHRIPTSTSREPAALGRATPDVAALGEGYKVYQGGRVIAVDGTSAATPAFAALVSLLNEARLHADMPPMGFLNPFLYAHPHAFTDVTLGTNAIGGGHQGALPYGFAAAPGWDAATGLGTPRFDVLLQAALNAGQR